MQNPEYNVIVNKLEPPPVQDAPPHAGMCQVVGDSEMAAASTQALSLKFCWFCWICLWQLKGASGPFKMMFSLGIL